MSNAQTLFLVLLATGATISTWIVVRHIFLNQQIQQALFLVVIYSCAYLFSRFFYIAFEAAASPVHLSEALDYRSGGLSVFGAIWGAVIGFLLVCGVQQRKLFSALDTLAPAMFPMAAFGFAARWVVDSSFYRTYPAAMEVYLPRFILPVSYLKPPDLLLLSAALMVILAWVLERHHCIFKFPGLKGNVAFSVMVVYIVGMESLYGFLRLHPSYLFFALATAALPLILWVFWFVLGRKGEDR